MTGEYFEIRHPNGGRNRSGNPGLSVLEELERRNCVTGLAEGKHSLQLRISSAQCS
jgi:hypothetical protein